jgi:flagellar hook-associated protein 3 FlgL
MRYDSLLKDVELTKERLFKAQQQITSGKKLAGPSDDPSAASDILRLHGQQNESAQYLRNLTSVQSKLQVTDGVLDSVQLLAERVRTLGQSSLGISTVASAYAFEVEGLRDQMISAANASHAGRFIFGGSVTTVPPYVKNADSTVAYQGNGEEMHLQVSRTSTVQTQIPGSEIFSGSVNVFEVISDLAVAMRAGDRPGIDAQLRNIEQFLDVVGVARSKVGGNWNLAKNIESEIKTGRLARDTELSRTEAADLAVAISEMSQSESGLQAALAVGARISQASILEYLK